MRAGGSVDEGGDDAVERHVRQAAGDAVCRPVDLERLARADSNRHLTPHLLEECVLVPAVAGPFILVPAHVSPPNSTAASRGFWRFPVPEAERALGSGRTRKETHNGGWPLGFPEPPGRWRTIGQMVRTGPSAAEGNAVNQWCGAAFCELF